MKVFIGLVTPDEELRDHFGKAKNRILPIDGAKRGYFANNTPVVTTGAYSPDKQPLSADFERFMISETSKADVCFLLIDQIWAQVAMNCSHAAFTVQFHAHQVDHSKQNFFHRILARVLRNYGQLAAKFDKGDDAQLLSLPLRNFCAGELGEIARLCRDDSLSPELSENIETQLVNLRRRVRPRRRSTYKTIYAVDDNNLFFKYGYERHAHFETGGGHKPYCDFNGRFRFGRRLDTGRHYNVSETEADQTTIKGEFPNCHGGMEHVSERTHLNMFPNDNF